MKEIRTEIRINATPEKVWKVLCDISKFKHWNPFITHAEGELRTGARLNLTVQQYGSTEIKLKPVIKEVVPNTKLKWIGRILFPAFFRGEYSLQLVKADNNSIYFEQKQTFSGFLTPFVGKTIDRTRKGFELMNERLKHLCERAD